MSFSCFLILSKAGQQGQCWCLLLHPQKVCSSQVFLGKFSFCLSFLILFKKPTGYSSQCLIMFFPALLGNRALKFPSYISPSGPCLCFIETLPRNELMDRLILTRGKQCCLGHQEQGSEVNSMSWNNVLLFPCIETSHIRCPKLTQLCPRHMRSWQLLEPIVQNGQACQSLWIFPLMTQPSAPD